MAKHAKRSLRSLLLSIPALLLACSDGGVAYEGVEQPIVIEGDACRVEYVVTGNWSTGFGADVTVTNKKSTTVSGWTLTWDFPSGQRVTSLWNGSYTQSGARVVVTGASWAANLGPGASANVGFNGSHSGTNTSPSKFYLSGVDCGAVKPDGTAGTGGTGATGGSGGTGATGTGATGATAATGGTGGTGGSSSCSYPAWKQGANYRTGDIVEYQGGYFIAEHDNPGYSPTISTWFWEPYAGNCNTGGTGGTAGSGATGSTGGTAGTGATGGTGGASGFSSIVSRSQWDQMLPNRNSLYSYDAAVAASQAFPQFASEGSAEQRKREVAAFLANISHETTGGWASAPGGPFAWGLYFAEEVGCGTGQCTYCAGGTQYPCASGKTYHGRGPMQLSYNYNYGQAGEALGLDLLNNPDLVRTDGVVAFKTAFWFWMTPQAPKPSAHAVMAGQWSGDGVRQPGFGMTVNIINGGLECNRGYDSRVADRIGFYDRYTSALGVSQGANVDCYTMPHY